MVSYVGRFAPSPTGPLHAGSLVAALASWLDARAHGGRWLVRLEDVDTPRCPAGIADVILSQLSACALVPDEAPVRQSRRSDFYQAALNKLVDQGMAYPCGCSRKNIETALQAAAGGRQRHAELIYPGTCRAGLANKHAHSWRLNLDKVIRQNHLPALTRWTDRRLGPQAQNVAEAVGDFVLRRSDGLWSYQLAVVVDDAAQGITHVVRGEDLADNTARQLLLHSALGMTTPPHYLHTPLVLAPDGHKLSKQNGALPVDLTDPAAALTQAAQTLGLQARETSVGDLLASCTRQWRPLTETPNWPDPVPTMPADSQSVPP